MPIQYVLFEAKFYVFMMVTAQLSVVASCK